MNSSDLIDLKCNVFSKECRFFYIEWSATSLWKNHNAYVYQKNRQKGYSDYQTNAYLEKNYPKLE
jgi:hypothetical protein